MDSKYFAHQLAHQLDYEHQLTQIEQLSLHKQSGVAPSKRRIVLPVRGWVSAALIATGQRMQTRPRMDSTQAEASREFTSGS